MTTEERLEKLEKELTGAKRNSRLLLTAVVAIVAVVFLLGASGDAAQEVVRAKEFQLVDANGQVRARLAFAATEYPDLVLQDQNGKICVSLMLAQNGSSGLSLHGPNGTCAELSVDEGGPSLRLYDQNDAVRAGLLLDESGLPHLAMNDQKGNTIWQAP